jgi:hypothetical protein
MRCIECDYIGYNRKDLYGVFVNYVLHIVTVYGLSLFRFCPQHVMVSIKFEFTSRFSLLCRASVPINVSY